MRKLPGALAALALSAAALVSCAGKPPELLGVQWRVVLEDSGSSVAEKLMLGCAVRDEDGVADLDKLYLLCDTAELQWGADKSRWVLSDTGGATRVGMNGIAMPDGGPIPRGSYRIILLDGAGLRSERSLVIAPPPTDPARPLRISRSGGKIKLSGPAGVRTILCYDRSGAVIETFDAAAAEIDQAAILAGDLAQRVASLRGYCEDAANGIAYLSAPLLP